MTQALTAVNAWPPSVMVALTGPSEMSSHHPEFCQNEEMPLPVGETLVPNPPRTINRPSASVSASPNGTSTFSPEYVYVPLAKVAESLGPLSVRGPGSIRPPASP